MGKTVQEIEIMRIAKMELGLDTLEARRCDSLDFHELSVWNIRKALEAAFTAGKMAGRE